MNDTDATALKQLINSQPIAALATLHTDASGQEPAVSMVPFAVMPGGQLVIHISTLASHTRDLNLTPSAALLVCAPLDTTQTPLALPRASIQGVAAACPQAAANYGPARDAYLARFAEAEDLFSFSDFSLYVITPSFVRYVAGFGRAMSIGAERFAGLFSE